MNEATAKLILLLLELAKLAAQQVIALKQQAQISDAELLRYAAEQGAETRARAEQFLAEVQGS